MVKFSDLYPLSTGGGTANIAGFEWSEKTADFVAEADKAYYVDTALGDILMTLPDAPANGSQVAFFVIGVNSLNITTEANIKGSSLATDYVRQVTENYLIFIFNYVDSSGGWDWNIRYNSYITSVYIGEADPYFNNVTLFLKGDGENNSTSINDSSINTKSVTRYGNTRISTAQSKYNGSSIYFDGNGDYLNISSTSDLTFSTGDFTIEAWLYCSNPIYSGVVFSQRGRASNGITFRLNGDRLDPFYGAGDNPITINAAHPANQWFHAAIVRQGNTTRVFQNGVLIGSGTWVADFLAASSTDCGAFPQGGEYYSGYIDSFRITKGVARYTATFNHETDTFLNI